MGIFGINTVSEIYPKFPMTSRKHAYIVLTPLKPHFYIVKLGFRGVYIFFLISPQTWIVGTR